MEAGVKVGATGQRGKKDRKKLRGENFNKVWKAKTKGCNCVYLSNVEQSWKSKESRGNEGVELVGRWGRGEKQSRLSNSPHRK